jgi:hypothetical protein
MSFMHAPLPSVATRQAEELLRAWVCGDLPKLWEELERSEHIGAAADADPDIEHLELLKSVASRMRCRPDLFAERSMDPQLGLCVDLLMHLASCFVYTD